MWWCIRKYSQGPSINFVDSFMGILTLSSFMDTFTKYNNRKIRKTMFIYSCGSKNGSSSSAEKSSEVWGNVSCVQMALHIHVWLGIWNHNSNIVIYEKYCSYLSISIFKSVIEFWMTTWWSFFCRLSSFRDNLKTVLRGFLGHSYFYNINFDVHRDLKQKFM